MVFSLFQKQSLFVADQHAVRLQRAVAVEAGKQHASLRLQRNRFLFGIEADDDLSVFTALRVMEQARVFRVVREGDSCALERVTAAAQRDEAADLCYANRSEKH